MTITPGFLAGAFRIGEENSIRALIPMGSTVSQLVIYGGAILLVGLAVFGWAIVTHRQRRLKRHSHHHRSKSSSGYYRRRMESSRPFRALAQAGGLPPIRTQPPVQPSP